MSTVETPKESVGFVKFVNGIDDRVYVLFVVAALIALYAFNQDSKDVKELVQMAISGYLGILTGARLVNKNE